MGIKLDDFIASVSAELIVAVIIFILGIVVSKAPFYLRKRKFRAFFGDSVISNKFKLVYGMLSQDPPSEESEARENWFIKEFYDGTTKKFRATIKMITNEVVYSSSYIIQELANYLNQTAVYSTDIDAFKNLNETFFSVGGPAVNEITKWALDEESNKYFVFSMPEDNTIWTLEAKHGENKVIFERKFRSETDYGMILKIRNSRFPNHFFFVFAGMGSWGTSGACWYFSKHWRDLYDEFKSGEFGLVVEVKRGMDTSAVRVFP